MKLALFCISRKDVQVVHQTYKPVCNVTLLMDISKQLETQAQRIQYLLHGINPHDGSRKKKKGYTKEDIAARI